MLILSTGNPGFMMVSTLLLILSQYKITLVIGGLILILLISILYRFKFKKKKKGEVIRPVTDIIGDEPERVTDLNKDLEPYGFAYEPYQDIFYSLMEPWQRRVGYCKLYDEASATLSLIIDCEPIRFEYGGKKWLIEFWKGQYGMTTGGEVGIYYTDSTSSDVNIPGLFSGTFYYCVNDEDRMNISFVLRKNGNLLLTRNGYHWWLTGFKLGEFSRPSELSMEILLDLYNTQMVDVFVETLKKVGYKDDEFSVRGRRVYIRYTKPHSPQPFTRTALTDYIMLKNNESFCNAYNYLTSEYPDPLDKLEVVRSESPNMYRQILGFGKPQGVFDSYNKLKNFLSPDENRKG